MRGLAQSMGTRGAYPGKVDTPFRKGYAPTHDSGAHPDCIESGCALVEPAHSRYAARSSISRSSRCWRCGRPANAVTRTCHPWQRTRSYAVSSAHFAAIVLLTGLAAAAPIAGVIWSSARSVPRTSWRPILPPANVCSSRGDAAAGPPEIGFRGSGFSSGMRRRRIKACRCRNGSARLGTRSVCARGSTTAWWRSATMVANMKSEYEK